MLIATPCGAGWLIFCFTAGGKCRGNGQSLGVMRILFLSCWYPYPPDNGSKLRIYGLLRGLAQYHEVTLISFVDGAPVTFISPEMRALCQDVHLVPGKTYNPAGFRAQLGLFSPTPRYIADTFSAEMADCIRETLADQEFDLVIAS